MRSAEPGRLIIGRPRPTHAKPACDGRSPGSRVAAGRRPSRFPSGVAGNGLAAYSCGGSHGIASSRARTVFPFDPLGSLPRGTIATATIGGRRKACNVEEGGRRRPGRASPAEPQRRLSMRNLLVCGLVLAAALASGARAETVDLQLILAADASISVDNEEFELQREGYAAAITSVPVLNAIRSGPHRAIAVCFIEWSGPTKQRVVVDWTVIRDGEMATVFANALRTAPRSFADATAIGSAIDFAMRQFDRSGVESDRRIIDISGDGDSNSGRPVEYARDDAVKVKVTINGLAIVNEHPAPGFIGHVQPVGGIGKYYRTRVTGGPGSFVYQIDGFNDFAEAIERKLVAEMASLQGENPAGPVNQAPN